LPIVLYRGARGVKKHILAPNFAKNRSLKFQRNVYANLQFLLVLKVAQNFKKVAKNVVFQVSDPKKGAK
jgi:hypothetical protein